MSRQLTPIRSLVHSLARQPQGGVGADEPATNPNLALATELTISFSITMGIRMFRGGCPAYKTCCPSPTLRDATREERAELGCRQLELEHPR